MWVGFIDNARFHAKPSLEEINVIHIHLHLQVMVWTSIFILVVKLVAPHFELVAPHDSQTEMEAVFPPTYPKSSHLTGWSTAIDKFYLKFQS